MNAIKRFPGLALMLVFVGMGCSTNSLVKKDTADSEAAVIRATDITAPVVWGEAKNVVAVKRLVFSDQPDAVGLAQGRDAGVDVVINLRGEGEVDAAGGPAWNEAAAVQKAGLTYYHVPIAAASDNLEASTINRISELVERHHDNRIWLHCSSGNRASAWFAIHLANSHGMSLETAIDRARQTGLTNPAMEARVRNYMAAPVLTP